MGLVKTTGCMIAVSLACLGMGCGSAETEVGAVDDGADSGKELEVLEVEPSEEMARKCRETISAAYGPSGEFYDRDPGAEADLLAICDDFASGDREAFESAPERLCIRQNEAVFAGEPESPDITGCIGHENPWAPVHMPE